MYDAEWYEIKKLQQKLAQLGISKKHLDLNDYSGLTRSELDSIVNSAIARKKKKEVQKEK